MKEKKKENKQTKALALLHRPIANSGKEVEKLTPISSKSKKAEKAAYYDVVKNAILTAF